MSTSRLKKRVEQDTSNSQYGNLLESFVAFGTALPSLASTAKDSNEFVPVWEQQVTDEQGRRRFHGAFTGGFSAGYFNTAGSKEGWTPSAFTSSRSIRASKDGASTTEELAQGFMDDEDLADLNSSRTLQTASAYAPDPSATTYDPLSGPVTASTSSILAATAALASLIEPASARIGLKLMRKMGWREGQGVGPRFTLKQRQHQAEELGIRIEQEEGVGDDEEAAKHYYAPLDRPLAILEEVGMATDRGWGLGYQPQPIVSIARNATTTAKKIYEDEEDEDVYDGTAMASGSKRPKWVEDLDDMNDDGFEYTIKGTKGKEKEKVVYQKPSSKSSSAVEKYHDGTTVLVGFVLHREPYNIASTSQLPPPPPRNWTPNPAKVWTDSTTDPTGDRKGKGRQLDADERGDLLGEQKPPPLPKSVFDYLSARSKERLATMTSTVPSASSSSSALAPEAEDPLCIPALDAPTALAALQGFQPFSPASTSADPARQIRYTLYLQFQAHLLPPSKVPSTLPFGPRTFGTTGKTQSIREFNKELDDYAKAARVFKPVSGMLAGRFTSSSTSVILEVAKVAQGLYQPPAKPVGFVPAAVATAEALELIEENLTSAQRAARAGMFGRLTRTIEVFRPSRLVCKRFGVKNPFSEVGEEEESSMVPGGGFREAGKSRDGKKVAEPLGKASMDELMKASGFRAFESATSAFIPSSTSTSTSTSDPTLPTSNLAQNKAAGETKTLENVGLGDDEAQGAETLTYTKAPADIFAAIFAESDDEDDDAEEEEEDEDKEESKPVAPTSLPTSSILTSLVGMPTSDFNSVISLPPAVKMEEEDVSLSTDNLASYRPSFVPTSARASTSDSTTREKEKKAKKEKKEKRKKSALSFDVDDGEEGGDVFKKESSGNNNKKKRKIDEAITPVVLPLNRQVKEVVVEEEDEWMEVEAIVHPSITTAFDMERDVNKMRVTREDDTGAGGGKRMRASDLY